MLYYGRSEGENSSSTPDDKSYVHNAQPRHKDRDEDDGPVDVLKTDAQAIESVPLERTGHRFSECHECA